MKNLKMRGKNRRGIVFILSMIFLTILASLTVSVATMSSANAQMANNHKRGNRTLANAQSGVEIVRYFLGGMDVTGSYTATSLAAVVSDQLSEKGLTGITAMCTDNTITFSGVPLDSGSGSFNAIATLLDDHWQADVTGTSDGFTRTIRVEFDLDEEGNMIFDFGVATKGPLLMTGIAKMTGINSDVIIDTTETGQIFTIGSNGVVEGNVNITSDFPDLSGVHQNSSVGGQAGTDGVVVGVDSVEFPVPDPTYFEKYVDFSDSTKIITSSTNLNDYTVDGIVTLNNMIIAPNTNITLSGTTVINGVLYIQQPNDISFAGQLTVNGIIVAPERDSESDSSSLNFSGQVTCNSVSVLDRDVFGDMCDETGSFLITPDSYVEFSGQSNMINGVIACNGIRFTGQAGGEVRGSVLNYSSDPMVLDGQGLLKFYESGAEENPAGFMPNFRLNYDPGSYEEIRN